MSGAINRLPTSRQDYIRREKKVRAHHVFTVGQLTLLRKVTYPPLSISLTSDPRPIIMSLIKIVAVKTGSFHHGMARPQVADGGTASSMEGSCVYIE